jgi:flagellum-specific ATP synthase
VLVEGDDLNEPVADSLRAILDGHIVLSRQLAHQGQFPAIDPLRSTSRLMNDLAQSAERTLAAQTIQTLALLERNQQMVEIGAYEKGSNPELDLALTRQGPLRSWMCQSEGGMSRKSSLDQLASILRGPPAAGAR